LKKSLVNLNEVNKGIMALFIYMRPALYLNASYVYSS